MVTSAQRRALVAISALLCALLAFGGCDSARMADEPEAWNLVVVLSDTHRADFAPSLSGERAEQAPDLPHLSALARESLVLEDVLTPVPISAPAYATLLTGEAPLSHGLLNNGQSLAADGTLLSEELGALGYHTGAVVTNVFCGARFGFDRGFDFFWDDVAAAGKEAEHALRQVDRFLSDRPGAAPFFLFLALMDAHTPYITPETPPALAVLDQDGAVLGSAVEDPHEEQTVELMLPPGTSTVVLQPRPGLVGDDGWTELYLHSLELVAESGEMGPTSGLGPSQRGGFRRIAAGASVALRNEGSEPRRAELRFHLYRRYAPGETPGLYARGVGEVDRAVGALLERLRADDLLERTVVVFLSDHGELLGEHDSWGHVDHLWREALAVPFMIRIPGGPRGVAVEAPAELGAARRWLLELAREANPEWRPPRTRSSVRMAATYPPEAERLGLALRAGHRKVVLRDGEEPRVYDLGADPAEGSDLWPDVDAEAADLADRAASILAHLRRRIDQEAGSLDLESLDAEDRRLLESLGYL